MSSTRPNVKTHKKLPRTLRRRVVWYEVYCPMFRQPYYYDEYYYLASPDHKDRTWSAGGDSNPASGLLRVTRLLQVLYSIPTYYP